MRKEDKYNEKFVSGVISYKLRDAGFDEPCLAYYVRMIRGCDGIDFFYNHEVWNRWFKTNSDPDNKTMNDPNCKCSAPLFLDVIEWFYNKHYINIEICLSITGHFMYTVINQETEEMFTNDPFKSFVSRKIAMESAILEALKIISK